MITARGHQAFSGGDSGSADAFHLLFAAVLIVILGQLLVKKGKP